MPKKSKGFRQLLKQQHSQGHEQQMVERLSQQMQQGPWKDNPPELVINPKGEVKMSEVLEEFAEPFLDSATTRHRREALFTIAIAAWNAALLPKAERETSITQLLDTIYNSDRPSDRQEIREIIDIMVARKEEFFADNRRYILNFSLEERGNRFYLSVVSTLMPPPKQDEATD